MVTKTTTGRDIHLRPQSPQLEQSIETYDQDAAAFAKRFAAADTASLRKNFRSHLPNSHLPILDAGCGTGRDLLGFKSEDVNAVGVDLSKGLLDEANRQDPSNRLLLTDFRHLPFGDATLRGVWAMASLVHLYDSEIVDALREFSRATIQTGPIFISVMHGSEPGWRYGENRWFNRHLLPDFLQLCRVADLELIGNSTTTGSIGGQWINVTLRRTRKT